MCTFVNQFNPTKSGHSVLSTLPHARDAENSLSYFIKTLGKLWLIGVEIDWSNFYKDEIRNRVSLPTYQWDYQKFWVKQEKLAFKNVDRQLITSKEDKEQDKKTNKGKLYKRPNLLTPYVEPQNAIQILITEIWQELLGIEMVGINDDFFELGGHSLMASQMVSRLNNTFGIQVPLQKIFQTRTIKEISVIIEEELGKTLGLENSRGLLEQLGLMKDAEE